MIALLKEFKPTLLFLGKFVAVYFSGNILYGIWIESLGNYPDAITIVVTDQSRDLLNLFFDNVTSVISLSQPIVSLLIDSQVVVSVFEGCNGVNVVIVFLSFLLAYGGTLKKLFLFSIAGVVGIHIMNLIRIMLLFFIAYSHPSYLYFTHKYLFTGIIYSFTFALWYLWVTKYSK